MYGLTRGTTTLIAVGAAGFLLWLATQVGADTMAEYWVNIGLIAAAGLVMALSQLVGGWTKWGWPTISPSVFLLAFLPALVAGGLLLLSAQPDSGAFGTGFADDIGLGGLAEDLTAILPAIAFGLGLMFGFTFDTTGPRRKDVVSERERVAEEPLTAEREHAYHAPDRDVVETMSERPREHEVVGAGATRTDYTATPAAPQPEPRETPRRGLFRRR